MSETHARPENYDNLLLNYINQTLHQEPHEHADPGHVTVLSGPGVDGYPKASSVWAGLPTWLLMLLQWFVGLGAIIFVAAIAALFWPIAAVYYHGVPNNNKWVQGILALLGFVLAIILYGLVLTVLLIVGIVFWIFWIIKDIAAVNNHHARPKLFHEYYRGLYATTE